MLTIVKTDESNPVFREVSRGRAVDAVVKQLQAVIMPGDLTPGEKLPPEREIAASMQISRGIVREALSVLHQRGLVETRQGSGTRVRVGTSQQVKDAIGILLQRQGISVAEICDAHALIEPEMAALAARRAGDDLSEELHTAIGKLESARHEPEVHVLADVEFHRLIARASGRLPYSAFSDAINVPFSHAMRAGTAVPDAI